MKVELNHDACVGCGYCFNNAKENFACDDEGYAVLKNSAVTDEARDASEMCPVQAISIIENE